MTQFGNDNRCVTRRISRAFAIGLLAFGLAIAWAGAGFAQVTAANVAEKIAAAKTPADHQAIAAFYRAQAADAAAKVETHEAMMVSYRSFGKGGAGLVEHCKTLIATYKAAEKDYTTMAAEQEALAKSGQ